MVDNKQINKWLEEGVISKEQADKMLQDSADFKKEDNSNKFIVTISTIGSILLGIGAILFIASNWAVLADFTKTLILVGSTFFFYYMGYSFKYQRKDFPKVGTSLMFLSGLLFGATLFLLAQIYNIQANNHTIVLIWLIGILPFVYTFISTEMAGLTAILYFVWITLYVLQDLLFPLLGPSGSEGLGNFFYLPVLYLVSGIALFVIGGLHYFKKDLIRIARIYRLTGLVAALFALYALTFRFFSGSYDGFTLRGEAMPSEIFTIALTVIASISIVLAVINLIRNPSVSPAPKIEFFTIILLIVFSMIFYNFPEIENIYVFVFNLMMAGIIFLILQQGYLRQDMTVVNIGIAFFVIFVSAKYFDVFWNMLDRSMFFIMGGMILISGGILLEKKRREISAKFKTEYGKT